MRKIFTATIATVMAVAALWSTPAFATGCFADTVIESNIALGVHLETGGERQLHYLHGLGVRTAPAEAQDSRVGAAGRYHITIGDCTGTRVEFASEATLSARLALWLRLLFAEGLPWVFAGALLLLAHLVVSRLRARSLRRVKREVGIAALAAGTALFVILAIKHPPSWVFSPPEPFRTTKPKPPVEVARPTVAQPQVEEAARFEEPAPFEDPCPKSVKCDREGLCTWVDGECLATTPDQCASSRDCDTFGRCTLQNGICVATKDDCAAWSRCPDNATCHLSDNRCELTPDVCAQSDKCATEGRCTPNGIKCVATTAEECERTDGCKNKGWCTPINGTCRPAGPDDCAGSTECKRFGNCGLRYGKCMPTALKHCQESARCRTHKECFNELSASGTSRCTAESYLRQQGAPFAK